MKVLCIALLLIVSLMTHQPTLLQSTYSSQDINGGLTLQHVKAYFVQLQEKMHEVVLEVNSQKFLIRIKTWLQSLEHFEVIAVKWFVDMWVKFMNVLKSLVTKLYFQS